MDKSTYKWKYKFYFFNLIQNKKVTELFKSKILEPI